MCDERARLGLDGHPVDGVAQSRADFDSGAGLGVSAVVAKPQLCTWGERSADCEGECALALDDEAKARHVALRCDHVACALALGVDPHRVGLDVHGEPARTGAVEHLPLRSDRAHAKPDVGRHCRLAVLVQRELS